MGKIDAKAQTVSQLLKGMKYRIDFYQREYKWQVNQIRELVEDLAGKFLEEYQPSHDPREVEKYPHYFLGPIIISKKDHVLFIVDGQQRLTSLTLLLILLRTLQKNRDDKVHVDDLIFSEKFRTKDFNLQVDERTPVMEALYQDKEFDPPSPCSESIKNLILSYQALQEAFPQELRDAALPFFIDWLLNCVDIVEITANSDDDAYTIFETMNDRGLSLTPTDMLKSYLLANIDDENKRIHANNRWRDRIHELNEVGKEVEPDCFKAWFRSQYSDKIRERKRDAQPENFDRIGTEFHRWLRDNHKSIGLDQTDDFYNFIERDFDFYSRQYLRLIQASSEPVDGLEHVLYNAQHGFTLQYMLLLAPINVDDSERVVRQKLRIVGRFVDILLARRLWNARSIAYSTMQYAMFIVMRDTRGLSPEPLAQKLWEVLADEQETFAKNDRLVMNQQNRYALHRLLARLTHYVETQSDRPSHYLDYVRRSDDPYEVEHIWANHPELHSDEFDHPTDFAEYRNRIGGLLLLPKSINASIKDMPYAEKLKHYNTQSNNLLARSLHPACCKNNPRFEQFVKESGMPFKSYEQFKKGDLADRSVLYRCIAERIWNPDDLLRELDT